MIGKLGRNPARRTHLSMRRAFAMHDFLSALPDDFAPTVVDYTAGLTSFGMMLNDRLGDCTIAGPGHMIQCWTAMGGAEVTVPDADILTAYEVFDGYNPADPLTDRGGDMLTVQQDWETIGIGGHKISGFGEVNITQMRWQQAVYCFGSVNVGVALPQGFESEVGGTFSDLDNPPDPTQGHDMACIGYNSLGPVFITWGALQQATWAWAMRYTDELLACVSPDWTAAPVPTEQLAEILSQVAT